MVIKTDNVNSPLRRLINSIYADEREKQTLDNALEEAMYRKADLSKVQHQIFYWLLVDETHGVIKFADEKGEAAIEHVAALHKRVIEGELVTQEEWDDAWDAARDAWGEDWYTTMAVARGVAEAAARDVAEDVSLDVADAAGAAAEAAWIRAARAARDADEAVEEDAWTRAGDRAARAAREAQRDKLLELLRADNSDNVNSPAHYTTGGIETIDIIRAKLTPDEHRGFCRGNIIKYVIRAEHKGGVEDFKKAQWYLEELIKTEGKGE